MRAAGCIYLRQAAQGPQSPPRALGNLRARGASASGWQPCVGPTGCGRQVGPRPCSCSICVPAGQGDWRGRCCVTERGHRPPQTLLAGLHGGRPEQGRPPRPSPGPSLGAQRGLSPLWPTVTLSMVTGLPRLCPSHEPSAASPHTEPPRYTSVSCCEIAAPHLPRSEPGAGAFQTVSSCCQSDARRGPGGGEAELPPSSLSATRPHPLQAGARSPGGRLQAITTETKSAAFLHRQPGTGPGTASQPAGRWAEAPGHSTHTSVTRAAGSRASLGAASRRAEPRSFGVKSWAQATQTPQRGGGCGWWRMR